MKTFQPLILLTLSVLAVSCYATEVETVDRIIGGTATTIENYPGLAQLEVLRGGAFVLECGSSLLNNWFILTSARCSRGRRVRLGATNRGRGGDIYMLEEFMVHPGYGQNGNQDDIALARVRFPVTFSRNVQPVSILRQGTPVPDDQPVIFAGWGTTIPIPIAQNPSQVLRHVTVNTVNREECRRRYPGAVLTDSMICASALDVGDRDACEGDFGGPLYWQNILVGIISWGSGCGIPEYPRVNTLVSSYTDWILATAVINNQ